MITFLHGADFHLDSPFHALSPEQAAERQIVEDLFAHHKTERTMARRLKQQQVKKRNMV